MGRFLLGVFFMLFAAAAFAAENPNIIKSRAGGLAFTAFISAERAMGEGVFVNKERLAKYLNTPGWGDSTISFFLLEDGKNKILFDAGLGKAQGGNVEALLSEAGVKPSDISMILITHMHGDHIGGLLDEKGAPLFKNAKLYIAEEETAYWESGKGGGFLLAQSVIKSYGKALNRFKQNAAFTAGVTSIPAFGHTPGHTAFMITRGKDRLLIWGDLMHAYVQFLDPEIYISYDVNPATAVQTRKSIFEMAAKEGLRVAGMHLKRPALGTIKAEGAGYLFTPEE